MSNPKRRKRRVPNDKKLRIALLTGGKSAEREISLKTGKAVAGVLENISTVNYRKFDPAVRGEKSALKKYRPEVAFIAMHGLGGEDGKIQSYLESIGVPYVGSGVITSMICMNKLQTKTIFEAMGIPTPKWAALSPNKPLPAAKFLPAFPVVVKPVNQGSSVGVKIAKNRRELAVMLRKAKSTQLVEKFVPGRELTVSVFGSIPQVLPVLEIRPKSGMFDYSAKYTKGMTDYICPAKIPASARKEINKICGRIVDAFQLKDMARIDLMLTKNNKPLFLEINTIPGMTETSLLPMAARQAGISFSKLIRKLVSMPLADNGKTGRTLQ